MRRILLDNIVGDEILARDIVSDSGCTLMVCGTMVKKTYISKLKCLNIEYIYVKDKYEKGIKVDEIIELQIKEQCQATIKETIELYSASGTNDLSTITRVADEIITDVLKQSEVIYNICGIREKSESKFAHSINVCALSVLMAIKMKLSDQKIKDIAIGSLLHDIGITYYNFDISMVDMDTCDYELHQEIKKHVIYGYSMISNEPWLSSTAKDIILSHHERLDGSGYPFGIGGNKIKKATKIVAICDVFDSLVYGHMLPKIKVHEAIDYIVSHAGKHFDLSMVKVFLNSVAAYPNGSIITTNRGDRGIVLRQNRKCPTRPIIRLLEDKDQKAYPEWTEIDLVEDLTLFIVDTEL